MIYRALADALVAIHFAFVLFVVLGGLFALRWPKAAWIHLPAAAWGVFVEYSGLVCPLTPWEVALRRLGRQAGYSGGFIEHYLIPAIYPAGLTRHTQFVLGSLALVLNAGVYALVAARRRRRRRTGTPVAPG